MMMSKKTKIVATLGPASSGPAAVQALIEAGVDVFRINMSHGSNDEHSRRIKEVRRVAKRSGKPVGVLLDLSGPKIRTGDFKTEHIELIKGENCVLTTKHIIGTAEYFSVSYKNLPHEVGPGSRILLDDGRLVLEVVRTTQVDIVAKVLSGGVIKGRRGVNVPGATLSIDCLTEKDRADLLLAKKYPVDFVALSFVRRAGDVRELRRIMKQNKIRAALIAKIETTEAAENVEDILGEADGLMIARGDLAVELSPEKVPLVQKRAISLANVAGKPVITATQMLDSMVLAEAPTRAEVSDVANAILDGTDALMLSNETAIGAHPVRAVGVMVRVAHAIESDYLHRDIHVKRRGRALGEITDAVTASAVLAAESLRASAIVALTQSGRTARMLSRHKPEQLIVACTPQERTSRALSLVFGVLPVCVRLPSRFVRMLSTMKGVLLKKNLCAKGDRVIVVCGLPFGKAIETNLSLVEKI